MPPPRFPRTVLILLLALALPGLAFVWQQRRTAVEVPAARPPSAGGDGAGGAGQSPASPPAPGKGPASRPPAEEPANGPGERPAFPLAAPPGMGPAAPYGFRPGGWINTFTDTFSGERLDPQKWSAGFGWGPYDANAWVASCAEPAAVGLSGGTLTLNTSPDRPRSPECLGGNKSHTSAAINTKGKFSQEYGFFEARLRMPGRRGVLGAWWLHRADGAWPPEIDIAEVLGSRPREHEMALHFDDPGRRGNESTGRRTLSADLSLDFHVYGVDWQPGEVVFYRDGKVQARLSGAEGAAYQRGPSYLIINSMVCTSASRYWCESPDSSTLWGPETAVQVDWVRVWRRER